MSIAEIDFGKLYRYRMANLGRQPKTASDWNAACADNLMKHSAQGGYVDEFLARMDLQGGETLLDVGCGPGSVCLPLADRFEQIYALDYSEEMLAALKQNIQKFGVNNVQGYYRAWEDDWSDIPVCDIAIASRSSTVGDLEAALKKLTAKARKHVYLTHIVGQFIEPAVLAAIGREVPELPDYIYVVNILYRMGKHPRIDYIETSNRLAGVTDVDDFVNKVAWSVGELSREEVERLHRHFYQAHQAGTFAATPMRWAFISWQP